MNPFRKSLVVAAVEPDGDSIPGAHNELRDDDIEQAIISELYYVFPGTCMTVCCLTLTNGFSVVGEAACVYAPNFHAETGRALARAAAKRQVWVLEGYRLKEWLGAPRADIQLPLRALPSIRYSPSEMADLTRPANLDTITD